jgi:toxin-antitoxin system PIN domain toxin
MKLPDVNLLVYAYDDSSPLQGRAKPWLQDLLSGSESVGFAWLVLLGFVRVSTRASLFGTPFTPEKAFDVVEKWLLLPNAVVVHPTERHAGILRGLLEPLGTAGNLTNDAHLAALAIEHGGEVCSADTDFARFRGLRWVNPLD